MMNVSFSDWRIEDKLQTPEARSAYIQAAAEENTPDALPDAFADVFRVLGHDREASACAGLAAYLRTVKPSAGARAVRRTRGCRRAPLSERTLAQA